MYVVGCLVNLVRLKKCKFLSEVLRILRNWLNLVYIYYNNLLYNLLKVYFFLVIWLRYSKIEWILEVEAMSWN